MDELMVARDLRKVIDQLLIDPAPGGDTNLLANAGFQSVERNGREDMGIHPAISPNSFPPVSTPMPPSSGMIAPVV